MFVGIYSILPLPHQLLDSGCIVHELESVSRRLIVSRQTQYSTIFSKTEEEGEKHIY